MNGPLINLKFKNLEKQIKQNLFVEDVEVFRDVKGTLYAKVQQRKPIVRIARSFGYDFYLDAKGNIFPMSQKFTARVLIAEGPFMNKLLLKGFKKDKTYLPYLEFMKRIEKDEFLSAQIHQISIDELGRIKMYQQVGQQVIEFGYPDEIIISGKIQIIVQLIFSCLDKISRSCLASIRKCSA